MKLKTTEEFKSILASNFSLDLKAQGGEVYLVGGCVRDARLNRKSKDIDIIVAGLEFDTIKTTLDKYGISKLVGESFSVIKFIASANGVEYDIALPRRDSKNPNSTSRQDAIIAQSDPYMPIEEDLKRRDFTINAIAVKLGEDGELIFIDPFRGQFNIKTQSIKMVDPSAFVEDPLRLLRAIQFAARFDFGIEFNTYEAIRRHNYLLLEISGERILEEFSKVISKDANISLFFRYLENTDMMLLLTGHKYTPKIEMYVPKIKTLPELLFSMITVHGITEIADWWKQALPISVDMYKEIKALEKLTKVEDDILVSRTNFFNACKIWPAIKGSLFTEFNPEFKKFHDGTYPTSLKDLNVPGERLMEEFGLKGPAMGEAYNNMLLAIFEDKVNYKNTDELLKFIK
jgi:tRNA nucleotidyltransferase/poly(A) polymerase